jgi:multidrug efflux pump subunit AcrB
MISHDFTSPMTWPLLTRRGITRCTTGICLIALLVAGAELQKPLALTVIGGLALSTPVTLLAVPGLYAAIKGRR